MHNDLPEADLSTQIQINSIGIEHFSIMSITGLLIISTWTCLFATTTIDYIMILLLIGAASFLLASRLPYSNVIASALLASLFGYCCTALSTSIVMWDISISLQSIFKIAAILLMVPIILRSSFPRFLLIPVGSILIVFSAASLPMLVAKNGLLEFAQLVAFVLIVSISFVSWLKVIRRDNIRRLLFLNCTLALLVICIVAIAK
jgi:hypothetical protein